jgi:uncharacterized protein YjbI with pentapeptide repeats
LGQSELQAGLSQGGKVSRADFSEANFRCSSANFSGAIFRVLVNFHRAKFRRCALTFDHVAFGEGTVFKDATFGRRVDFKGARFGDSADFTEAVFKDDADFSTTTFGENATFTGAAFHKIVDVKGATFGDSADFTDAIFKGAACFSGTTLGENATFTGVTFHKIVDFTDTSEDQRLLAISFKRAYFLVKLISGAGHLNAPISRLRAFTGRQTLMRRPSNLRSTQKT